MTADDFVYAWQSQRGGGVDIDGQPDQVASTIGYRDIASVVAEQSGKTVTVAFNHAVHRLAGPCSITWSPPTSPGRVGWNTGFAHFDPSVELSAGPMIVQSVSGDTAVLVRNPQWWGTPAVLRKVTVNVGANRPRHGSGRWLGNSESVAQVTSFDLATLGAVTVDCRTPRAPSRPSLDFLELEFNVRSPLTIPGGRAPGRRPPDRPEHAARTGPSVRSLRTRWSTGPPGDAFADPATPRRRRPGEYSAPGCRHRRSRCCRASASTRIRRATTSTPAGRPLTLRMAVETGDPWIDRVAGADRFTAAQRRDRGGQPYRSTAPRGMARPPGQLLRHGPGHPGLEPVPDGDRGVVLRRAGPGGFGRTEDWSKLRRPADGPAVPPSGQSLNPVTGGTIYAQIDDQLWDQMVALPAVRRSRRWRPTGYRSPTSSSTPRPTACCGTWTPGRR